MAQFKRIFECSNIDVARKSLVLMPKGVKLRQSRNGTHNEYVIEGPVEHASFINKFVELFSDE